jgi:hypothetical protein
MQNAVTDVKATVDGINIQGLESFRIQSPLFSFTLPKNNILGLPSMTTQAVSDGNWVFLQPLSIGKHIIYFKGGLKNDAAATKNTFAGPYGWDYPITYHITVINSTTSSFDQSN